jgi:HNH endonuclease
MKTKFGDLAISAVLSRIDEYRLVGESAFLHEYANSRGAKSTWISYEGELFPSKAIFRAAFLPVRLPPTFQTSDTYVFARELGLELVRIEAGVLQTGRSAIEDLDELNGSDAPTRTPYFGERFVRDGKIRAAVLVRAKGRCEHCGAAGFKTSSGKSYLETHHIISLAKQGPDTLENVIALCANHHREAHFGEGWEQLEAEFKAKLAKLRGN